MTGSDGQILLAESDPASATLANTLLTAAGYEVTQVEDGAKAFQAAQEWVFDLILLELPAPVADGLGAARQIRRLGGRSGLVPILGLMADDASPAERIVALSAGVDDFIHKPIIADVLLGLVAQFLPADGGATRVHAPSTIEVVGDHPDLDPAQLDNLARLVPMDQLEAMVRGHLGASQALLLRMKARAEALDLPALGLAAHECRGSWAELGARRVQHLAAELERLCHDGDGESASQWVEEIGRAAETAGVMLDQYLIARRGERRAV